MPSSAQCMQGSGWTRIYYSGMMDGNVPETSQAQQKRCTSACPRQLRNVIYTTRTMLFPLFVVLQCLIQAGGITFSAHRSLWLCHLWWKISRTILEYSLRSTQQYSCINKLENMIHVRYHFKYTAIPISNIHVWKWHVWNINIDVQEASLIPIAFFLNIFIHLCQRFINQAMTILVALYWKNTGFPLFPYSGDSTLVYYLSAW